MLHTNACIRWSRRRKTEFEGTVGMDSHLPVSGSSMQMRSSALLPSLRTGLASTGAIAGTSSCTV